MTPSPLHPCPQQGQAPDVPEPLVYDTTDLPDRDGAAESVAELYRVDERERGDSIEDVPAVDAPDWRTFGVRGVPAYAANKGTKCVCHAESVGRITVSEEGTEC